MRYASLLLLAACGRIAFDETSNVDGSVDTPAPNVFSRLVAYGDNTCAEYNGHAYCWGANVSGQIGDGTTMPRPSPTRVTLPDGALQGLTIGETHGCVILSGAAWCWGEHAGLMGPAKPAVQLALSNVTDIAAGKRFTCMVSSGTASCFGADDVGQLGDSMMVTRPALQPIATAKTVIAIDAGDDHACATTSSGPLCWGHNDDGALGNGLFDPASSSTPVDVMVVTAIPRIAGWHACALENNSVFCWGRNAEGELGDNTTTRQAMAQRVPGLDGVTYIATGGGPTDFDASCAIAGGRLFCWGAGTAGRLGTGGTANELVPREIQLPGKPVEVALGYAHTCALLLNGELWCWGRGNDGQLGSGMFASSPTPVRVQSPGS